MSHASDLAAFVHQHRRKIAKLPDKIYLGSNSDDNGEGASVYLCKAGLKVHYSGSFGGVRDCNVDLAMTAFTKWGGHNVKEIIPWLTARLKDHGVSV